MVSRNWVLAGLIAAFLTDAALAQTNPTAAKRGETLVKANCADCHAVLRTGDSPNAKAPPFRTLGQRYKLDDLQEALAEGIVVGHGGAEMPHFIFEPTEIDDIIAYLKSINPKK